MYPNKPFWIAVPLGVLNIQSKLWHFEFARRKVVPRWRWHCLPCLDQTVLHLMSEHNAVTALRRQRPQVLGRSSSSGSLVGLDSRNTASWGLLIEGGYRITESQNGRSWKGPLWVI